MPLAVAWMDWGSTQGVIVWWLAFAVGFVVGGFVVGLIVQGLVALLSRQKVPLVVLWLIRILGGIVCGWLLALLLSGRGPGGFGGSGGFWGSSGNGPAQDTKGSHDKDRAPTQPKESPTPPQNPTQPVPIKPTAILDVEVLPLAMTNIVKPGESSNKERYYRVSSETEKSTITDRARGIPMDLAELSQRIHDQTAPPVSVVNVILYKDSPALGSARPEALDLLLRDMRNSIGEKIEVRPVAEIVNTPR